MSQVLNSPTLALLYLAQGHPGRARGTIVEVLAADPDNGHALALQARLRERPPAELSAVFVASATSGPRPTHPRPTHPRPAHPRPAATLALRWSVPEILIPDGIDERDPGHDLHIVFAIARLDGPPSLRYSSLRCGALAGEERIPMPAGPASIVLSLAWGGAHGSHFHALAVTEALCW